jgi:exosortase A
MSEIAPARGVNGRLNLRDLRDWLAPVIVVAALLLVFRQTAAAMVDIWIRSATFQHGFLVLPIVAWLVWRKRAALFGAAASPVPWLLLPIGVTCVGWLLGEVVEVAAASQFALVTLVVLSVPALFGWGVTRVLAFPLLFLYFAVPFGEFAVPTLQEWTADVTVAGLKLTGIPVYREGMQFVIPSGTWSVVAACSGVRYLIACLMVGTLFAYLNYRTLGRRLLFVLVSIIVPIIANWIRAYTIVMIGHLTGSPMILGVEHTTYGWVLFGVIVLGMFAVAARWTQDPEPPHRRPADASRKSAAADSGVRLTLAVAIVLLAAGTQAWASQLVEGRQSTDRPSLTLPPPAEGWQIVADRSSPTWPPGFVNPAASTFRSYQTDGRRVDVWMGYYRNQNLDSKLAASVNRVVARDTRAWRGKADGSRPATSELPRFQLVVVSEGAAPSLSMTYRDRVWYTYWLNDRWLLHPAEVKLWQAVDQVLGRGDDGAVLMLSTPLEDDADRLLERFVRSHLPAIRLSLIAARDSR